MEPFDDIVESAEPPHPPRRHDAERRTRLLLQAVAVAAVATAAFTGVTAWETHQDRVNSKTFYCNLYSDPSDPHQKELADELDC